MKDIKFTDRSSIILRASDIQDLELSESNSVNIEFPFYGKYRIIVPALKVIDTYDGKHPKGTEPIPVMTKSGVDNAKDVLAVNEFGGEYYHYATQIRSFVPETNGIKSKNGAYILTGDPQDLYDLIESGSLGPFGYAVLSKDNTTITTINHAVPTDVEMAFSALFMLLESNDLYIKERPVITVKGLSMPDDEKFLEIATNSGVLSILQSLCSVSGTVFFWCIKTNKISEPNTVVYDVKGSVYNSLIRANFSISIDKKGDAIKPAIVYSQKTDNDTISLSDGFTMTFEVFNRDLTGKEDKAPFIYITVDMIEEIIDNYTK